MKGDDLTRDQVSTQMTEAVGVGAHRLNKPPLADQKHVVLWVIKGNDIRFQKGRYREIIKFVQDQLKEASEYRSCAIYFFEDGGSDSIYAFSLLSVLCNF